MNGPSDQLRAGIFETVDFTQDAPDSQIEAMLNDILDLIDREAAEDFAGGGWDEPLTEDAALQTLGAVEAWTGLASAAVARVYAPASPWPRKFAGWAQSIAQQLRALAQRLTPALQAVSRALGAVAFTIGLAFPWGITVSLSWP